MTAGPLRLLAPALLAVLVAAAWPLSAYVAGPVVLPALLIAAGVAALIVARLEAGIAVVLVLAPFMNAAVGGGRPIRVVVSGLALLLLVAGLLLHRRRRELWGGAAHLPLFVLAFLATGAISALFAEDPAWSLPRFLGVVAASALYFAVVVICRRRDQLAVVVGGALIGLLLAGLQGVSLKPRARRAKPAW